jgi:hypothetical protein
MPIDLLAVEISKHLTVSSCEQWLKVSEALRSTTPLCAALLDVSLPVKSGVAERSY